jgi:acetyl esterase
MKHLLVLILTVTFCLTPSLHAQDSKKKAAPKPTTKVVFKKTEKLNLDLHIFTPEGHKAGDNRPAIVFFFGGGWNGGSPSQFYPHCQHLASKGMVAISANYRTKKSSGTTPDKCVIDGKSAVRYIRQHAKELGINPDMLAAGGGSAGGHVAAAVATTKGYHEEGEDAAISTTPNALVLFNPVYDNGPEGYGYDRVKDYYKSFSPMHNIRKGMPPTLTFLGTKDSLIPVATAEAFKAKMESVGSRSELMLFKDRTHGFSTRAKVAAKITTPPSSPWTSF